MSRIVASVLFNQSRTKAFFASCASRPIRTIFFSRFCSGTFSGGVPVDAGFFPDYVRTNNYLQCSCIWLANVRTIAVCRTLPKTASLLFFFLKVQCEAQISETSSLFTRGCIVHSGSWRFFIFERERERFEFVLFESRER